MNGRGLPGDAILADLRRLVLWTTARFAIDYWGRWSVESPSLPAGPSRAIVVVGAAFMVLQVVKGGDEPGVPSFSCSPS